MSAHPFARLTSALLGAAALLALLSACAQPRDADATLTTQATLPSGFEDALVADVARPTALAFTPDGRLLIASQGGELRVLEGGNLSLAHTVSSVCSDSERGLLGVAVDPEFAQNSFIYLFYTFNKFGTCAKNTAQSPVNRVVRLTLEGNTVAAGSQLILLDNIPSPNGNHNAGDLHFGRDGLLYVSVGDGGCDYEGGGCGAANDAARSRYTMVGKILRITKTGGVPAGNPFQGPNSVRCNLSGRSVLGKPCREVFALGLRNPFRLAFDPNASGTRFFINDVGQNRREEVNLGRAGADYGWNLREGACATGTDRCGAAPAGLTNPVYGYRHTTSGTFAGCRSISGGAFVPSGLWPGMDGSYLFSDFICGTIFKLTRKSGGGFTATPFVTGLGAGSAVHLRFGPDQDGTGGALYYTTYAGGGQVRLIRR